MYASHYHKITHDANRKNIDFITINAIMMFS